MLVKRSRKNQIAIPQALLDLAGLGPNDVYFRAEYRKGAILLFPVEIEDKIPIESLARFKTKTLAGKGGDRAFRSMGDLIQ